MTVRPPILRQDLVDRLRALTGGRDDAAGLPARVLGRVARPLRRVVVRLVDPSLQVTLDQIRRETAAQVPAGTPPAQPEIEVLRAELASTHKALLELGRRLDDVERRIAP